ncbi:hypothetical protein V2J09_001779 [Rumex salicifolius]
MRSLGSSLAFSAPTKLTTSSPQFIPKVHHSIESQLPPLPQISSTVQFHHGSSALISRRNVLGLGIVSGGLLDAFLLRPEAAPAAEGGACEFTVAPSGIAFCDRTLGDGPQPTKGQLIKAHYVGKLENGKVFDSSYNRGKPLAFKIGVGEVIKGWDEGILGGEGIPPMLPGGKRTLKIPPQLGYGMRGAGCRGGSCIIPPDSVLLFDVEYIGKA